MPGWTETPLDADEAHRHPYELWYASPPGAAEIGAPRPDRYYPQIVALELSVSGKTTPLGAFLSRAHAAWQALTRPAPAGGSAPTPSKWLTLACTDGVTLKCANWGPYAS